MKFPFLASFIVFVVWLKYELGKSSKKKINAESDFWKNEQRANEVRKKPLNDLAYIEVPMGILPYDLLPDIPEIKDAQEKIASLAGKKIVNLTGYTNTELKFTYGTANITVLSEYDENFTTLVSAIQQWASALCENDHEKEAIPMLEFAIDAGSDVRGSYGLLFDYYVREFDDVKIEHLKDKAASLNSLNKESILRLLSPQSHVD